MHIVYLYQSAEGSGAFYIFSAIASVVIVAIMLLRTPASPMRRSIAVALFYVFSTISIDQYVRIIFFPQGDYVNLGAASALLHLLIAFVATFVVCAILVRLFVLKLKWPR